MDLTEITKEVQREFNEKRIKEEATANANLKKANSYPVFHKIVKMEKDLIFELGKAEANGDKTSTLKKELKEIKSSKKEFLKKLGLEESDLEPKYECKKCKDVGFIGTIACECFGKAKNEKIIKKSGLEADGKITFDSFNSNVCKNEKQSKELEKLKQKLLEWCDKFPNVKKKNIILTGTTGSGKTFASKCVCNRLASLGFSVCFVTAFQMNEMFLKYHTTFDSSKSSVLVPLTESDLLVIDDLGTEPLINNVTINYLYLILSERERFDKPVFVTTNLLSGSSTDILDRYGDRIQSRLLSKQSSFLFKLEGDDLRIKA